MKSEDSILNVGDKRKKQAVKFKKQLNHTPQLYALCPISPPAKNIVSFEFFAREMES